MIEFWKSVAGRECSQKYSPCPILGTGEAESLLILSVEGCVLRTENWVCDDQEETEGHVKEA